MPKPEQMPATESEKERPSKEDIEEKVTTYKRTKERLEEQEQQHGVKGLFPPVWESSIRDLRNLSKGEDYEGMREEYFPGWENEDFKELLKRLGEEE